MEHCLYGREAFIIDFMPPVHQKPPVEEETVKIYAMRLLKAVLKGTPETGSKIHVVGDKCDGLLGHSFSTSSKIGNWTKIVANTKRKVILMKAIYETWEVNGFGYISSLSTAKNLCVWLSGGFEDRIRAVCLSHNVGSLSFEEFLCSTHEEADTRITLELLSPH